MTDQPTGVKTNGLHQQTTNHLNLTRSLADVREDARKREYQDHFKVGYAGRELHP